MKEKSRYFQCSFCGDVGHRSDNCAARLQAYQEQQKGYLCSYCGATDHVSSNCVKLKENLAREKAEINQRNAQRYEASRQNTAKGQEHNYQSKGKEGTSKNSQDQQAAEIPLTSGGALQSAGNQGGMGSGGQPPRKPEGGKEVPPDKIVQEDKDEDEDSDPTITISESSTGSGVIIKKKDGTKISIKELLKMAGRKRRRRRKNRRGRGKGGGDSPSSSGGSEDDDEESSSDLDIREIRGKRGHRGQRGRVGPQGPPGPTIKIPVPTLSQPPTVIQPQDANITVNNEGMERSFHSLSDSLTQMFVQQASLNQTLHSHLTQGIQAQGDQALALQQLALSSHQREYDRLFDAIPIYDGEDPSKCEVWIEKLETACRTGKGCSNYLH